MFKKDLLSSLYDINRRYADKLKEKKQKRTYFIKFDYFDYKVIQEAIKRIKEKENKK